MKKNIIICGDSNNIQNKAVNILTETLLDYTGEPPVCISHSDYVIEEGNRYIFIGTKENNPYIKKMSASDLKKAEEYLITVSDDNVIIEGSDEAGVLYGCIDFYEKYILPSEQTHSHVPYFKNIFEEKLPDFEYGSSPDIKQRGFWTWGYVIYDFKGYIDDMARLKLNTLIIWNDYVPYNAKEMIEYAHSANVKIFWGFPWGWDICCGDMDLNTLMGRSDEIAEYYEKNYASIGGDGIYFQSATETTTETIGGVLVADAVTEFVNSTAEKILKKHPNLEIQFGLHATSVKNKLDFIGKVNPKISIVWEDCGAFPFAYIPQRIANFDETVEFTKKIVNLRGKDDKFGVVLKGFTCLDWINFKHLTGPVDTGYASKTKKRALTERKRKIWRYVQAYWLRNADKAYEMIKLMQNEKNGDLCVTALLEDSMFEDKLYYPAALYAQMLWDTKSDIKDIMCEVAARDYIEFA